MGCSASKETGEAASTSMAEKESSMARAGRKHSLKRRGTENIVLASGHVE